MKILLTGKPGIGKSTILEQVTKDFKGNKLGIISRELRNKEGKRVGFEAVNHLGKKKTFAHTTDISSDYIVGGKYYVDLSVINKFAVPEIKKGIDNPQALVFIDEIGRMQAFSRKFLDIVSEILNSDSNVLATIVLDPEPWSLQFKQNKNTVLIEISEKNRDQLPKLLSIIFDHSKDFHKLRENQQELIINLSKEYFKYEQYLQLSKLFNNAIPYLVQNRIKNIDRNKFQVKGNTNTHLVTKSKKDFLCDCDLFYGQGQYSSKPGQCSHIQAVRLFQLN